MNAATDLNTKLETALNVEFVVAENLREQIYEAMADLNSLTKWPALVGDTADESIDSRNEEVITDLDSHDQADVSVEDENVLFSGPDSHDTGVKFNCFPRNHSEVGKNTNNVAMVPSTQLSYLNHAELLRKYSGI